MLEIGNLFFCGLSGLSLTNEEKKILKKLNFGGVVLFSKNYENRKQLKSLCQELRSIRSDILIAVDHEGGRVQRFRNEFTEFPPMRDVGKQGSPKLCFDVHQQMGRELISCGVNVNLSPCSDILIDQDCEVIGDRAFGDSATEVEKFVTSSVRGLQTVGVMSCSKHFPGHGNTSVDSHIDLPKITDSIDVIRDRDLIPFRSAVKSKVSMVMMAHLLIPALDQEKITTLSPNCYSFLRRELRFEGIVITDDMEMGAIEKVMTTGQAAYESIKAGATIVEYRSFEKAVEALEFVESKSDLDEQVCKNIKIIENQKSKILSSQFESAFDEKFILEQGQELKNKIYL